MSAPHAPKLDYLCDDWDCCSNGCPHVSCRACGEDWPCTDWRSRHSEPQIRAQVRYVERKWWHGWDADTLNRVVEDKMAKLLATPENVDGPT